MLTFRTRYSLSDVADGDGTATTLLFAEKCGSENQGVWNCREMYVCRVMGYIPLWLRNDGSRLRLWDAAPTVL